MTKRAFYTYTNSVVASLGLLIWALANCSFNVETLFKTGIEYIKQMTYAVGSLMLKSIVVIHIVLQLRTPWSTLTERSISSKMDKPWQTLGVYSSKTMHQIYLKFSVNAPAMVLCSKPPTNFSLHRHFKTSVQIKRLRCLLNVSFRRTYQTTLNFHSSVLFPVVILDV